MRALTSANPCSRASVADDPVKHDLVLDRVERPVFRHEVRIITYELANIGSIPDLDPVVHFFPFHGIEKPADASVERITHDAEFVVFIPEFVVPTCSRTCQAGECST